MPRVPQGRIILQGTLCGGAEVWTMSHACDPLSARTQSQLQSIAQEVGTIFEAWVWDDGVLGSVIPASIAFTGVRVDDVQDPGGVVRTAQWDRTEPLTGASINYALPPECSIVVSLRTTLPGPRRRGRMYFPPLGTDSVTVNGQLGGTHQTSLADCMQDYFNAFNSNSTIAATAFVASDAAQALTAITSIQVGNVYDAQRRRRNALQEAYVTKSVTP